MSQGKTPFTDSISEDHRGTPEEPGRVVTLIERSYWEALADNHHSAPDRVWGVAYRIKRDMVSEVKDYLDIREINGYSIQYTPFHPADGGRTIRTLVYIGTPDNPQFAGVQDPVALSEHISRSHGPSGPNPEYLFNLETSLNDLSKEAEDHHINDLSNRVRAILELNQLPSDRTAVVSKSPPANPDEEAHHRLDHSVEELEEVEKTN
ncbi:related to E.coli cation transport protein [Cephalotrichum gorgonifer]|uniref:glutathione-specific gamma-glutamylcyclotransferase n=1 Tax=Cephalotrichum gorgonifer TaxID=2041049 RepID=A0AAE8MPB7_9PEZI|nr:related to E.coli cation transport protein [Cephalotrichum gorgonifer]